VYVPASTVTELAAYAEIDRAAVVEETRANQEAGKRHQNRRQDQSQLNAQPGTSVPGS
jgi:hypothetical protein